MFLFTESGNKCLDNSRCQHYMFTTIINVVGPDVCFFIRSFIYLKPLYPGHPEHQRLGWNGTSII